MAIEFHCPYCTATVRVGDDAAGKIGRCPKCDTKVRVPQLPPEAKSPTMAPEPSPSTPEFTPKSQIPSTPPPAVLDEFPDLNAPATPKNPGSLPVVPVTDDPVTSKYLKRRKKKKKNYASLIAPLIFGGIFVVIALVYYNKTKPTFDGELAGEKLNPNQSIQIELRGETFNIDQDIFSQIVDELRKSPSAVQSNLVSLTFAAGAGGMEMSLRPGIQADLIKVPITKIKTVAKYYKENFEELDDARVEEIQKGLNSLAEDWAIASEDKKIETLPNYRNSVAYNAFVKGLGRIVYARIERAMYPCVHEDGSGNLYFLIPIGAEKFTILERKDLDETPFFPSELKVDVTIERPQLAEPTLAPVEPESESIPVIEPSEDSENAMPLETTTEMTPAAQNMMSQ